MMKAMKISLRDYIKANRKASREAEIENHTRPVNFSRVHKSKMVYDRQKMKADDKRRLPFLWDFFSVLNLQEFIDYNGRMIKNDCRMEIPAAGI